MPVTKVIMLHIEDGDQKAQDDIGLGTQETERSNMSRIVDAINMEMFTVDD